MKTISVLLTKYSDWISSIIYHLSGHDYTHASLSFEEEAETFYSFNYRGFCIETLDKHRRRGVTRSLCYQLEVPDCAYDDMKMRVAEFKNHREEYQYTRIGVLFAFLHIPFRWEKHYICSQFVAELLSSSGAVTLKRYVSVYLPNQFCTEFEQSPQLKRITYNPL